MQEEVEEEAAVEAAGCGFGGCVLPATQASSTQGLNPDPSPTPTPTPTQAPIFHVNGDDVEARP